MEKKNDDILGKLRRTLTEQGVDSFHILEELIPIEEQMEYFKYFEKLRNDDEPFLRDEEISILFSSEASLERKKKSLLRLSSIPDVGAYRAIETYQSNPLDIELKNWSSMALVSSRITLNSDLSGQQQIYISSGLGGHDKKLRFFALFTTVGQVELTDFQKEIAEREFKFQLHKSEVDIEKFEFSYNYFTILMLFPFDIDIKTNLTAAVTECNQYGNFIDTKYLFTNVKVLSKTDIEGLLANKIS